MRHFFVCVKGMALNVCAAKIDMEECRGPVDKSGIKSKEYCHFFCSECRMDCYRVRDIPNGILQPWTPSESDNKEEEVIQSGKTQLTHAEICKHVGKECKAEAADYQSLIEDLVCGKNIVIDNSIKREFKHFTCECGLDVYRYRDLGVFVNGNWQPLKNLLPSNIPLPMPNQPEPTTSSLSGTQAEDEPDVLKSPKFTANICNAGY